MIEKMNRDLKQYGFYNASATVEFILKSRGQSKQHDVGCHRQAQIGSSTEFDIVIMINQRFCLDKVIGLGISA